jgi:hypothetical protein
MKKIRNRDYLKKKAVKTGSLYMHQAYKKARNEVTKNIKQANTSCTVLKQPPKTHKRCGKLLIN